MDLTITQTLELLRTKKVSAEEITQNYLNQIEKKESQIDAYLVVTKDKALEKAKKLDKKGDFSTALAGVPLAIKDCLCTKGIKTTAGSKILKDFIPPYTATAVQRVEDAGAIILGKANTDEFTMGSSTENSAYKTSKNPWDTSRVPGGSSGGPGAAVAANECVAAIGTDTGGSIRQPANFCGCVGLKVTYGRVSRYGAIPYASSFDSVGPITKTVEDAALMLEIMAGQDPKDTTTANIKVPKYSDYLQNNIKGKIIGIPKEFLAEGIDTKIKKEFLKTADDFAKSSGMKIEEISLPMTEYAIAAYYILAKSEASTNLAKFDGIRFGHKTDEAKDLTEFYKKTKDEGFGDEAKRAIMMGTFALSSGYYDAYYKKAAQIRTLVKQEYEQAFEKVDVIFAPVSPMLPFKIGEKADDPLQMYLADAFTVPINLSGIPGLAVPTNLIDGLPTGLQILGPQFAEETILNIGWHLEEFARFNARFKKNNFK